MSKPGTDGVQAELPREPSGSSSVSPSEGVPSQPQARLDIKTIPPALVLGDNEIEQIWYLRRRGVPCPGTGDKERPDLHILAEQFWKEQAAEAAQRFDAYSASLAASNNELYQLVGFYSVFQGVLLTASAQSNLLCCSNWWIPVSLCALSTLCTCWGIWLKLTDVAQFRYQRNLFNAQHKHRVSQLSDLRQLRDTFKFPDNQPTEAPVVAEHFSKLEILIFVAVIAFSAIIGWGSYTILCIPGTPCK